MSRNAVDDVTYNVADGKEGTLLLNAPAHVAAVVALADDALVALDLGAKGLLAADEEEGHGWLLLEVLVFGIGMVCIVMVSELG